MSNHKLITRYLKSIFIVLMVIIPVAVVFGSGDSESKGTKELVFWWWGESEAPGLEGWVSETVDMYKEVNSEVKIETVLQSVDNVTDDFTTASAAGDPPDIQYSWNGVYHQENVWRGYVEPLNNLFSDTELIAMDATDLSIYKGEQYRTGWYLVPSICVYNKRIFKEAGIPEDLTPPENWDEFIKVSDILKAHGVVPFAGGFKDGWWGEWYAAHGLIQSADDVSDITKLVTGDSKWTDPKWYDFWTRLETMVKSGYFNEDANSLEHYQGVELFFTGKAAMSLAAGSLVAVAEKYQGAENVGVMKFPTFGSGKLASLPIIDIQGIMISSKSKNKNEAADFIRFMHSEERLQAMYDQTSIFPADKRWKGWEKLESENSKTIWDWFLNNSTAYAPNMIPWAIDSEAILTAPSRLMAGTHTAEDLANIAQEVTDRWREENPDLFEGHKSWAGLE